MYRLIVWLTGIALRLFYRQRREGPEIPDRGPVIIVANHPNALVDPAMICQLTDRRVRFLAKEPLFRTPGLKYLVKGMGALPVYRAMDGHDTSKNEAMFEAVHNALGEGAAVCLFPEGISHNLPELQPLKTGAARMALGAEADHDFSLGLKVVPVGFTYRDKRRYRSEQSTFIGEPIEAGAFKETHAKDQREAASALTEAIHESIRDLTVNMEKWEDWPRFELAERIWADDGDEKVSRIKRLANAVRDLRSFTPDRLHDVEVRIDEFKERLDRLGMVPEDLDHRPSITGVSWFLLRNLVALTLLAPIALIGATVFFLPFMVSREVPKRMSIDVDEIASFGLLAAIVCFPLWLAVVVLALVPVLGTAGALSTGGLLIPAGLYASYFIRRRKTAWRDMRVFFTFGLPSSLRREILSEKRAIAAEMDALAEALAVWREEQELH